MSWQFPKFVPGKFPAAAPFFAVDARSRKYHTILAVAIEPAKNGVDVDSARKSAL
jgi:hypothetical protein